MYERQIELLEELIELRRQNEKLKQENFTLKTEICKLKYTLDSLEIEDLNELEDLVEWNNSFK